MTQSKEELKQKQEMEWKEKVKRMLENLAWNVKFQKAFGISLIVIAILLGVSCSTKDTPAPTTSKCGCSSKTKSQCYSPCSWTTGKGCGC